MEYSIGILLAIAAIGSAVTIGLARDRSFYSTIMIWIASYYVLFALMGGSRQTLILESLLAAGFMIVAVIGFKANLWIVVAALVGHGLFDFVHHQLVANPGVPQWCPASARLSTSLRVDCWPFFCQPTIAFPWHRRAV